MLGSRNELPTLRLCWFARCGSPLDQVFYVAGPWGLWETRYMERPGTSELTRKTARARHVTARNTGGCMLSSCVRARVHVGPLDDARSSDTDKRVTNCK